MKVLPNLLVFVSLLPASSACSPETVSDTYSCNHAPEVHIVCVTPVIDSIWNRPGGTDWKDEWEYGWDGTDLAIFGKIGYDFSDSFQRRRYYRDGCLDVVAWTDPHSTLGVFSSWFDEERSLNEVVVRTGESTSGHCYNQPEDIAYGSLRNLKATDVPDTLLFLKPCTVIFLFQIILRDNGIISESLGECRISGFSSSKNLLTGLNGTEECTLSASGRMKKGLTTKDGRKADITGGLFRTFGEAGQDSRHILETDFILSDGTGATCSFDITDQVRGKSAGGILTVEVSVDTLNLHPAASEGFSPGTYEYEDEGLHEITMGI